MARKINVALLTGISVIFLLASFIQAEDAQNPLEATTGNETENQWLWGEIVSVGTSNNTLVVKYLDYDTDEEKEVTLLVDEKTTYEGVKSLDEIKPQDAAGIDYIVSADGRYTAINISIERPEGIESLPQDDKAENLNSGLETRQ